MMLQVVEELNLNINIAVAIYQSHLDAELAIWELERLAGPLFTALVSGQEDAASSGGMSVLGGALVSLGVPTHSAIVYEMELAAGKFVLVVRGTQEDMTKARNLLQLTRHEGVAVHAACVMAAGASYSAIGSQTFQAARHYHQPIRVNERSPGQAGSQDHEQSMS